MQVSDKSLGSWPAALLSLLCGLLFGVGLLVSGMSNPAKVLNFLDIFGNWDASLAFVMGGAVMITVVGYPLTTRKRSQPRLSDHFQMPSRTDIDRQLLLGATLFGIGWGIGGFCPGPAWTAVTSMNPSALVFIVSMLIGMWAAANWRKRHPLGSR